MVKIRRRQVEARIVAKVEILTKPTTTTVTEIETEMTETETSSEAVVVIEIESARVVETGIKIGIGIGIGLASVNVLGPGRVLGHGIERDRDTTADGPVIVMDIDDVHGLHPVTAADAILTDARGHPVHPHHHLRMSSVEILDCRAKIYINCCVSLLIGSIE